MTASPHPRTAPRTPPATRLLLVAVLGMLVAGCGASSPSAAGSTGELPSATPQASAPASPAGSPNGSGDNAPSPEPGGFACALPVSGVGSTARAQITDVRVGTHDGYDRIAFEFSEGIPRFTVDGAEPPFTQDGSGLPLEVEGSAVWLIRLEGGTRQGPDGNPTYAGPTEFRPEFPRLLHLVEGGDFEAISTWYVGLTSSSCLSVTTLTGPFRLVIDIEH
ncbi:MAG: AMIN-like domain-containing (lipo)protein [Candidatus Limnocylindria bacterium]